MVAVPPWAHGAYEQIREGREREIRGSDRDRRQALICFDNAVEISIQTMGSIEPRIRGRDIPREKADLARGNFPNKLSFLEWWIETSHASFGVAIPEVAWYHRLRNELYHAGNGLVPEARHVMGARQAALAVFRVMFGDAAADVVEADLAVLESSSTTETPAPAAPRKTTPPKAGSPTAQGVRRGQRFGIGRVQAAWTGGFLVTSDEPRGMYGNKGRRGGPGVGCGCREPAPRLYAPNPAEPEKVEPARYEFVGRIPDDYAGTPAAGLICGRCNRAMVAGS